MISKLFWIYRLPILAGVIVAPALALVGCQLAARDKAMQTLCLGQGATLGVLLGLAIAKTFLPQTLLFEFVPFLFAFGFSFLAFLLSERLAARHLSSRNTVLAVLFASTLAIGYLVCALFPALENHMSLVFFGDLATLSDGESQIAIVLGLSTMAFLAKFWRQVSGDSFNQAIFGQIVFLKGTGKVATLFQILSFVLLAFSVQFLGFLFTVACLFLPTILASGLSRKGLDRHFVNCGVLAAAGTLFGAMLSLYHSRLPTVPTIIVTTLFVAAIASGVLWLLRLARPLAR